MSAYCVGLDIRVASDVSRSAKLVANGLGSLAGQLQLGCAREGLRSLHVRPFGPGNSDQSRPSSSHTRVQREGRGSGEIRREELPPSAFVMDYDHDWAFPSLLVPVVEATSAVR